MWGSTASGFDFRDLCMHFPSMPHSPSTKYRFPNIRLSYFKMQQVFITTRTLKKPKRYILKQIEPL